MTSQEKNTAVWPATDFIAYSILSTRATYFCKCFLKPTKFLKEVINSSLLWRPSLQKVSGLALSKSQKHKRKKEPIDLASPGEKFSKYQWFSSN